MSFVPSNLANIKALILLMPSYERISLAMSFMALNERISLAISFMALNERISLAMSFMALNERSYTTVLTTRHSESTARLRGATFPELSPMNFQRSLWIHQQPFFHRVWFFDTDAWLPDLHRQWSYQHSTRSVYCIALIWTDFFVHWPRGFFIWHTSHFFILTHFHFTISPMFSIVKRVSLKMVIYWCCLL